MNPLGPGDHVVPNMPDFNHPDHVGLIVSRQTCERIGHPPIVTLNVTWFSKNSNGHNETTHYPAELSRLKVDPFDRK